MNLALVGATGVVGEQILEQLAERSFPVGELRLFASEDSVDNLVDFAGESFPVAPLAEDAFADIDLVIFATPAAVSSRWEPVANSAGAVSVDLSEAARLESERALIVSGVNEDAINGAQLSTPSSLVVHLARLLKALGPCGELTEINVTAIAPASAAGRAGFDELQKQAGDLLNGRPTQQQVFENRLAFNCLPAGNGQRKQTQVAELRKVTSLPAELPINLQQLTIPLFFGEGGYLNLRFAEQADVASVTAALQSSDDVELVESCDAATPLDAIDSEQLLVCLAEQEITEKRIDLWFAADNAGSGGALNLVRLVETLALKLRQ